jgi:hypothetical protein
LAHHFREFKLKDRLASFLLVLGSSGLEPRAYFRRLIPVFLVLAPLGLWSDKSWEVVAGQRLSWDAMAWETQFEAPDLQEALRNGNAESLLREAHRFLSIGQRAQALTVAQEIVVRYPRFQLGQLLFADLLSLVAQEPFDPLTASADGVHPPIQRIKQLNEEARVRLSRPEAAVYKDKVPEGLLFLSSKLPFLIVVDASHSRLYVLTHDVSSGTPKADGGLRVIYDAYMSVGQRGMGKQQRGDAKTPFGVYFTQKSYPGHVLPDLYGAGAVTLNYPNDLDLLDGKTGSGIWIHGSPSDQYARAPEATDGCVVLANPDMQWLMGLQLPAGTPVLIQSQINWVEPRQNKVLRDQWAQQNSHWREQKRNEVLAMIAWTRGSQKMMASLSLDEETSGKRKTNLLPAYWIQREQVWSIVPPKMLEDSRSSRLNALAPLANRQMVR